MLAHRDWEMDLARTLDRIYWWLERRVAPGVRYAQSEYEDSLVGCVDSGCQWLDLGCGRTLLPEWRSSAERAIIQMARIVVGVDPDQPSLRRHGSIQHRVCGDGSCLPFSSNQFNLVTANMVLEHLPEPIRQFGEVYRVLGPRGRFLFHTPNGTGYPTLMARAVPDIIRGLAARIVEGREKGDRFPTYYRANTPSAIQALAATTGFLVERIELVRSNAMFPRIPPIAAVELLFIRTLAAPQLGWLRPNLIAVLRKAA